MEFINRNGESESQCPMYGNCVTARVLNEDYCRRYKCNTYHQIDTILVCARIHAYLDKHSRESNEDSCIPRMNGHRIEKDIARIVQEAVEESRRR